VINYYTVLEVRETASADEIKAAFKKKAVQYHPDKNPDNPEVEEIFKQVNSAYQTLSNEYTRASYDLKLQYSRAYEEVPPSRYPAYPQPYHRPRYRYKKREKISSKENLTATLYAVIFTVVVSTIVMGGIWGRKYYNQQKHLAHLEKRRSIFNKAKVNYERGNLSITLKLLNQLGGFFSSERDIEEYKEDLIKDIKEKGDKYYKNGKHKKAIQFFEILEDNETFMSQNTILKLAQSYKKIKNYETALHLYTQLLTKGYRNLTVYGDMADIYMIQGKNELAISFYDRASDQIIKDYKSIYGDAYPLVISAKFTPPIHYAIFTGLVEALILTEDYERALKATKWNIRVWPDSSLNYLQRSRCYQAIDKPLLACENFQMARLLGYDGNQSNYCN